MKSKKTIFILFFTIIISILFVYCHNVNAKRFDRIDNIYLESLNILNSKSKKQINLKTDAEKNIYNYFSDLLNKQQSATKNSYSNYKDRNINENLYKNIDNYYNDINLYSTNEYKEYEELIKKSQKSEFIKYLESKNTPSVFVEYLNKKIDDDEFIDSSAIKTILEIEKEKFDGLLKYIDYLKSNEYWGYIDGNIVCRNSKIFDIIKDKNDEYSINIKTVLETSETNDEIIENEIGVKKIPILMYHGVSDETWGIENLFMEINSFEEQMKYIHDNNYETIFIEDIQKDYKNQRVIALTFDDGYADFYTNVFPILKRYNIKANLYIITNYHGDKNLSADEIKEISKSGLVSIGSHTSNHYLLTGLSDKKIENELKESKEYLEKLLDKKIRTLCYPSGKYDSRVISKVSKYYDFALAIEGETQKMDISFNRYAIKRLRVYRNISFNSFKKIIKSAN